MKKRLLKNEKGFSLVELLIVLGILAVIAAISVAAFSGILGSSRDRADTAQAKNIQKAIASYIAETEDVTLSHLSSASPPTVVDVLTALQQVTTYTDASGATVNVGPYLESRHPTSITATDYAPQGNGHTSWEITVFGTSHNVTVSASSGTFASDTVALDASH